MNKYPSKVTVICMTYNQSAYILDALHGFASQDTNFPYICVVMDDASTDGEQAVINEYLNNECEFESGELIAAEDYSLCICRHKTNYNCTFAVYLLTKNLYRTGKKDPIINQWRNQSTYIAPCEGDDYWIDPNKLQKQADFLDTYVEYGFIGTRCLISCDGEFKIDKDFVKPNKISNDGVELFGNVFSHAINGPVARTCSLMYRNNLVRDYQKDICGDLSLEAVLAHDSFYARLDSASCVYRIHSQGVSHPSSFDDQIRYYYWQYNNQLALSRLYPEECHFRREDFEDRKRYLYLKHYVHDFSYNKAMAVKRELVTDVYKQKRFSRFAGPFSFFLLAVCAWVQEHL